LARKSRYSPRSSRF